MNSNSYYVYKYVYNEEIIYIGLTDDIQRRIKEHASGVGLEVKFLPFLDHCEIYYHVCGNEVEMKSLESLLINKYKPVLNIVDVQSGQNTADISIDWTLFNEDDFIRAREEEITKYRKSIKANETRITNYIIKQKELQNHMRCIRPFYEIVSDNFYNLSCNPNLYIAIPRENLPKEPDVYVGSYKITPWYDEQDMCKDVCMVQFSGEFLRAFFAIGHKDNWIDYTLDYVGGNQCKELSTKINNLTRKNDSLRNKIKILDESHGVVVAGI